jgi:RNA polymerase sigma-70 factor, ECF subfamily
MSNASEPGTVGTAGEADEHALVEAAKRGDRDAMNQLLTRHWALVDRLCHRMLRNRLDAEDARQEALVQAARRIATFEGRSSFSTWIYTVTRHVCLNEIKRAQSHPTVSYDEEFDESAAPAPGRRRSPRRVSSPDGFERVSQRLDIDSAMREVSPAYHAALVMFYFGDMSLADIATELKVPVNTVKTKLFKGKAQLARLLAEGGEAR